MKLVVVVLLCSVQIEDVFGQKEEGKLMYKHYYFTRVCKIYK